MTSTDILYEKKAGVAWITINRPEVRNAFRTKTVADLTGAFVDARWDPSIGVVVLTGAGDKAFCAGGDQKERGHGGYARDQRPMDVEALHSAIRHIPKPVIAMAKQSFNIDSEPRAGVAQFAHTALNLYYGTEEAMEGRNAFVEKRPVDFKKFRR